MGMRKSKHKKEMQIINNVNNMQMLRQVLSYSAMNSLMNYNTTKLENSAFNKGYNHGMNNNYRLNNLLAFNPFIFGNNLNDNNNNNNNNNSNTLNNINNNNNIIKNKQENDKHGRGLKDIELQNEKFKFSISFNP